MHFGDAGDTQIVGKAFVMVESVGLIGLGLVGTAIAERLLAEGFEVLGFDIDSAKRNQLVKSGGKTAESAAEVGEPCADL